MAEKLQSVTKLSEDLDAYCEVCEGWPYLNDDMRDGLSDRVVEAREILENAYKEVIDRDVALQEQYGYEYNLGYDRAVMDMYEEEQDDIEETSEEIYRHDRDLREAVKVFEETNPNWLTDEAYSAGLGVGELDVYGQIEREVAAQKALIARVANAKTYLAVENSFDTIKHLEADLSDTEDDWRAMDDGSAESVEMRSDMFASIESEIESEISAIAGPWRDLSAATDDLGLEPGESYPYSVEDCAGVLRQARENGTFDTLHDVWHDKMLKTMPLYESMKVFEIQSRVNFEVNREDLNKTITDKIRETHDYYIDGLTWAGPDIPDAMDHIDKDVAAVRQFNNTYPGVIGRATLENFIATVANMGLDPRTGRALTSVSRVDTKSDEVNLMPMVERETILAEYPEEDIEIEDKAFGE